MQLALANSEMIDNHLAEEIRLAKVVGPLMLDQFKGVQVSRFGLVP